MLIPSLLTGVFHGWASLEGVPRGSTPPLVQLSRELNPNSHTGLVLAVEVSAP